MLRCSPRTPRPGGSSVSSSPWEPEPGTLSPWQDNPESFTGTPTGAQQVAPEVEAAQATQAAGGVLSPWNPVDFTAASQSWFGGRNVEGERNGWDSDFYRRAIAQQDEWLGKASAEGKGSVYFQQFNVSVNKEATGVATWDDPKNNVRAGDVFKDGKFVNNIIDDFGWRDAATMMAPLLFDGVEQKRLFDAGSTTDNTPLIEATQGLIAERTRQAEKAPTAEAFQDLVEQKKVEDGGTESAVGSFAAGAGAGAAAGAALGSIVPGLGTAIGAVGGALIGGAAAWANRDQMTELVARTQAQTEIARQQQGDWSAAMAQLSGWSQVAMTAASPLQNATQGVYDEMVGGTGDGVSEFYKMDANGSRQIPAWMTALNLTASVGDAFSQFASVPARALYTTTMATNVLSGAGQLATDTVFDPTSGTYHDLEGLGEHAAAFGSVGIDAVQLGMARALIRSANSQRALVGMDEAPVVATAVGRAYQRAVQVGGLAADKYERGIDKAWAAVRGKTLPGGYTTRELNGMRYFFGEDVTHPVAMRMTAQLMAPSELFRWLPNGARARMRAARSNGMPSADDMYTAGLASARQGNKLSTAVVTGFAEGTEEGLQATLDPQAYGESAGLGDIAQSAAMGFAAGMGMSLGATLRAPGMPQRMQVAARRSLEAVRGVPFTNEEWKAVQQNTDDEQLMLWARADTHELQALAESSAKFAKAHAYETGTQNVAGAYAAQLVDDIAARERWNQSVPNTGGIEVVLPRTNTLLLVTGQNGTQLVSAEAYEANEVVGSLWRTVDILARKLEMTELQQKEAQTRLAELEAALAGTDATDTDRVQFLTDEINETRADIAEMGDAIPVQRKMVEAGLKNWEAFTQAADSMARKQIIDSFNTALRNMGKGLNADGTAAASDREVERNRRAAELFYGRQPYMDTGGVARFVPQVSLEMSEQNQNGSVHLPQTSLKAPGADHDGDFVMSLNGIFIPRRMRRMLRLGGQYMPKDAKGNPITDGTQPIAISMDVPDAEEQTLDRFRQYFLDPNSEEARFVTEELVKFEAWATDRYETTVGTAALREALDAFRSDVRGGVKDARLNFTNRLINLNVEGFIRLGDEDAIPEAARLMEKVTAMLEIISLRIAQYNHANLPNDPNLTPAQVATQQGFIADRPALMAETHGALIALSLSQDGQRSAQQLNYISFIQSAVRLLDVVDTDATIPETVRALAYEYSRLTSGSAITAIEEVDATDIVGTMTRAWLKQAAEQFRRDNDPSLTTDLSDQELMLMVGSLQVRSFRVEQARNEQGALEQRVVLEDGTISVLQMLLRAAVQQEEARLSARQEPKDSPVSLALQKMKRLTYEQKEGHSYSASAALLAVYGPGRLSDVLPNTYHLLGADAQVDVFVSQITSKHEKHGRRDRIDAITKNNAGWVDKVGDPPYTFQDILDKRINPHTIFVNAVKAVANRHDDNLARRNKTAHEQALKAFNAIQRYIDVQSPEIEIRLQDRAGDTKKVVTREEVVGELLSYDQQFGKMIVSLMPVDSLRATFAFDETTGMAVPAKWVGEALQAKPERGLVMFHWHAIHDHMRLLEAGVQDLSDPDIAETTEAVVQKGIPFDKLTSRTEQLLMIAQWDAQHGGMLMLEMQRAMDAATLEESYNLVNQHRGDMAPLQPWYDSVSEFEMRPTDLYSRSMASATLREQYKDAANRLDQMADSKAREVAARNAELADIKKMIARIEEIGGVYDKTHTPELLGIPPKSEVDGMLKRLYVLIKRAPYVIDGVGYTARDEALAAAQNGVLVMHNKGAGDPFMSLVGGFLPLLTSFGLKQGLFQEIDNMTTFGSEDVLSNLTKLLEGPTHVTFLDGSHTTIDMTTVAGVLNLLVDPVTNALAKTAITPHVRDVTASGTVQQYAVYEGNKETGLLTVGTILERATNLQYVKNGTSRPGVQDAHAFLSQIEGMAMRMAESLPPDPNRDPKELRQEYTLAVQNMLNDYVVAYASGPNRGGRSDQEVRDNLVQSVTQALIELAQLNETDRETTRALIKAKLVEQLLHNSTMLQYLAIPADIRDSFNQEMTTYVGLQVDEEVGRLRAQELQESDPVKKAELKAKWEQLLDSTSTLTPLEQLMKLDQRVFLDLTRARESFKIDWSDPDAAQADAQRLLKFITSNSRLLHMRNGDAMREIHNLEQTAAIFGRTGSVTLEMLGTTPKEMQKNWNLVSEWAARIYTQDRLTPTSIEVGFSSLDTDQDAKYFDPTFSFLVDELFNDKLIESTRLMLEECEFNKGNSQGYNSEGIAKRIMANLFPDDLIAERSVLYPAMAMQVRKALTVTPVQSAVPAAGDNPKDMADAHGASIRSYRRPLDEHFSKVVIGSTPGELVKQRLVDTGFPFMVVKLQNHYARAITITDPSGTVPAYKLDALAAVGRKGLDDRAQVDGL